MLPYAEPLAHEIMSRRPGLIVSARNPRHQIIPFPCTAYDVVTQEPLDFDAKQIGVLAIWHYFHGDAKNSDGSRFGHTPLRINRVQYRGEVPDIGDVLLIASEFPNYGLAYSCGIARSSARENFSALHPLFRLDNVPIDFVTHETDGPERARYLQFHRGLQTA